MHKIILATGSPFRRELFQRLGLPFQAITTEVDETPHLGERVEETVIRLALAKAKAAAILHPDAICIGSDELGALHGQAMGKSGNRENAQQQLMQMSGQKVYFHTALALVRQSPALQSAQVVTTAVQFRDLNTRMIENYLDKEEPYQSAASFKSESLGSALISRFEGEDPSAIIGLPLITLCDMLRRAGIEVV